MKNNEITPIVFATDENYVMPTAVAIKSLVSNYSGENLLFVILIKSDLSADSENILRNATADENIDVEIKYCKVDERLFGDLKSHIPHISMATYYRLLLPQILPDHDKCLYLDGDIIVNGDIRDLLDIPLLDEEYAAGAKAFGVITSKLAGKKRLAILNIDTMENYVNAGVLLLNIEALRRTRIAYSWIKLAQNDFPVQDQDVINVACFGHIKILPPKYNAMPAIFRLPAFRLRSVFPSHEISEAKNAPCIIHYAEKYKPWKYSDIENAELWYQYYRRTYSQELNLKKLGLTRFNDTQKSRIDYLIKKVRAK